MSTSRFAVALAILTLLLGPSQRASADEGLASVKGVVTLDGKPLAAAKVIFHLTGGQFVGSKTDEDGAFKVDRVPAGTHKVTVEKLVEGRSLLPPRYAEEDKSALRAEVEKGVNTLNLLLKSK